MGPDQAGGRADDRSNMYDWIWKQVSGRIWYCEKGIFRITAAGMIFLFWVLLREPDIDHEDSGFITAAHGMAPF